MPSQEHYRDARFTKNYDGVWQSVGKCVFCDLNDKYVFFEENGVVMTVSLYAYIDGHIMIVPRRHVRSPKELTELEWSTVRKFTYLAKKLIKHVHGTKGMQLIQKDGAEAQSTVADHLHFHCVPFDAPDLMEWHYRRLSLTPLESAGLYKAAGKTLLKQDQRFVQKYRQQNTLPVVCDILIVNRRDEILLQVRADWARLVPDTLTTPGGGVDDFDKTFEQELAREVREETGLELDVSAVKLVASRVADITRATTSKALGLDYTKPARFVWNTYLLRDFDETTPLRPGDDCKALLWVPRDDIAGHPLISDGIKALVASVRW